MSTRLPRPAPRSAGLLVALAAGILSLTACGSSGFAYQRNTEVGAAFKLPNEWTTFDKSAVLGTPPGPQPQTPDPIQWLVGFDAASGASAADLFASNGAVAHPQGIAAVFELSATDRDTMSFQTLRNFPFPVDALSQNTDDFRLVSYDDHYAPKGGYRGVRLVYQYRATALPAAESSSSGSGSSLDTSSTGPALLDPTFVQVSEVALVDQSTQRSYYLAVWCDASCYSRNASAIDGVVQSWAVNP